jgi:hypothetical protein
VRREILTDTAAAEDAGGKQQKTGLDQRPRECAGEGAAAALIP